MKKLWMVGALVLTVAVLFALTPNVTAGAATSDFIMEGTTLVSYTGTATTVSVPDNVEIIGRSAFEKNSKIKKVTLPNSVTTIEEYAFWGCTNLETVYLGKGLYEVADFTFTACENLSEVYIPDNIRRIGIMTFAECKNLQKISIPVSVTDIHETAFDDVPGLEIIAEEYSDPYRYALERAKRLADAQAEPEPTETPVTVVEVVIPTAAPVWTPSPTMLPQDSGTLVGSASIVGNKAVLFVNNTDMEVKKGTEVSLDDFKEEVVVKTAVLDWSYYGDKSLSYVEPPKTTSEIGSFAYARSSLRSITLPQGVEKIEYAAFYHCDNLKEIYIPDSVTRIEAKAFSFTPWLEAFLSGNMEAVGDSDFLIVGDNVLLAYRGSTSNVVIPEGVKHIAAEAFLNHEEIETVTFPTTLLSIDSTAFAGCDYQPMQ